MLANAQARATHLVQQRKKVLVGCRVLAILPLLMVLGGTL